MRLFKPNIERKLKQGNIKGLVKALRNKDGEVRCAAARALGKIGDTQAINPLVVALRDSYGNVRAAAAEALERLGDAQTVEPLVQALTDEFSNVRVHAAEALGRIRDTRAVEPLAVVLRKDEDSRVRSQAARGLGQMGDARALGSLVAALIDKDLSVRYQVVRELESLGWQPLDDNQRARWAIAREDWKEAVSLGSVSVEPLIGVLGEKSRDSMNKWTQQAAAEALGEVGDARAVMPLLFFADGEDGTTVGMVIRALGKILERDATNIATRELYTLARQKNSVGSTYIPRARDDPGDDDIGYIYKKTLDWSHIRQLAQQELIRCGLKG
jgi:HEAT repeat protein